MFRVGLLLIIRRVKPVQTATGIVKNCCLYRVDPPDDEQQARSKLLEASIEIN